MVLSNLRTICISIILALLVISFTMQPSALVRKLKTQYNHNSKKTNGYLAAVPLQAIPRLLQYNNSMEELIRRNNNSGWNDTIITIIRRSSNSSNHSNSSNSTTSILNNNNNNNNNNNKRYAAQAERQRYLALYCNHMIPLYRPLENWRKHHNNLVETIQGYNHNELDVLFLGDSITEQWNGTRFMGRRLFKSHRESFQRRFSKAHGGKLNGLALGTSEDRLQNLNWHIQNGFLPDVAAVSSSNDNPKIIWILIGTNNFIDACSTPETVSSGIVEIIHEAHSRKPNATVVVQGILPRSDRMGSFALGDAWSKIQATNSYLKTMSEEYLSSFLHYYEFPSYKLFQEETNENNTITTTINSKLFRDGVHPSTDGYDLLGQAIEAEILKLLSLSSSHR